MSDIQVEKINHILEGLCITANALHPEFQPQFDCYIEQLNFNNSLSFDENFKQFFMMYSFWKDMKKMSEHSQFIDWQFQMENIGTLNETINHFFHRNLFSSFNVQQLEIIMQSLILHLRDLTGEFIDAQQGYISPPNKYLPAYIQHWQHLYIKGQNAEILITFESNT
ncbi:MULTISPECIES: hypothetical protein [unclassified Acinetobacter]|uniref:hypothetical protein n=1 Tax=unclassified Acinetobacter TaxID=196816 RepID=UPI002447594A|nr:MULTISPECIES: hypothetical protein [unclassified Acinetobacter]MDH0031939.1 hypothetical protein [Acinetobacter sp. GD04021]MDH0887348.1 hypothetical protein [Acinetobacter sp. GD03873]MDH1083943.1 hypothetical protein [Acinetobacter sp. GD03983]MDH2190664.1 hypothetical protein [Acinetobacter sp. GD03645]MDH2202154.1 hypothetical protein [Acinetobacter sp. GD03647]